MGTELDLDDVAGTSPLAQRELDVLRAEVERLRGLLEEALQFMGDVVPDTPPEVMSRIYSAIRGPRLFDLEDGSRHLEANPPFTMPQFVPNASERKIAENFTGYRGEEPKP